MTAFWLKSSFAFDGKLESGSFISLLKKPPEGGLQTITAKSSSPTIVVDDRVLINSVVTNSLSIEGLTKFGGESSPRLVDYEDRNKFISFGLNEMIWHNTAKWLLKHKMPIFALPPHIRSWSWVYKRFSVSFHGCIPYKSVIREEFPKASALWNLWNPF